MSQINSIIELSKISKDISEEIFYIRLIDIFAKDLIEELKKSPIRDCRLKMIEKIETDLKNIIKTYKKRKNSKEFTEEEKTEFIDKKNQIKQKLLDAKNIHNKMLLKNCVIV